MDPCPIWPYVVWGARVLVARGQIDEAIAYAIDSGLMENNPVPPVRVLKKRSQTNHPALAGDRVGNFLRALDAATTINEEMRIAMLLVLLTACRKAEVIEARREEFDLKAAQWEIPATRMKAKRSHWVESRELVEIRCPRQISVADIGILAPADIRDNALERFVAAPASAATKENGQYPIFSMP